MSNSGMEMIVWKTWFISFFIDIQFVMKITDDFLHNLSCIQPCSSTPCSSVVCFIVVCRSVRWCKRWTVWVMHTTLQHATEPQMLCCRVVCSSDRLCRRLSVKPEWCTYHIFYIFIQPMMVALVIMSVYLFSWGRRWGLWKKVHWFLLIKFIKIDFSKVYFWYLKRSWIYYFQEDAYCILVLGSLGEAWIC